MFGIIADLLTTVFTVLFPIFASYKALRAGDPAQLVPWLMYWIVISIVTTVEDYAYFILGWFPFYSWLRLGLHIYLVMPGQGGATALYQVYIDPFLVQHEAEIEELISSSHARARAAGLEYLNRAINWFRVTVLGQQPAPPTPPSAQGGGSYAQQLLSRFNLPSARDGIGGAGDMVSLLASALQSVTSGAGTATGATTTRDVRPGGASTSDSLIPPGVDTPEARMNYIARQRENLNVLMQAFDREASNVADKGGRHSSQDHRRESGRGDYPRDDYPREDQGYRADHSRGDQSHRREHGHRHSTHAPPEYGQEQKYPSNRDYYGGRSPSAGSHLSKSRSEVDFERIESDEAPEGTGGPLPMPDQNPGSWMPWNWRGGSGGPPDDGAARSSGVDLDY